MSAAKPPEFESLEYDTPDVLAETARVLALEAAQDRAAHEAEAQAKQQAVVAYAVQACITSCIDALSALYVDREECPISSAAQQHNSWQQDPEPEPCRRDAWLRGAMPLVAPMAKQPPPATAAAPAEHPTLLTSTSRPSTRDKSARTAHDADKDAASTAPATTPHSPGKSSKPTRPTKEIPPEQQEAAQRLRQELQIRRQQEALAQSLKQQDAEMRQQFAVMQRDLKGKEYTYDQNGKVLLLNRPAPSTLPAPVVPNVKLGTTAAPAKASSSAPDAASSPRGRGSNGSTATAAAAGSGARPTSSTSTKSNSTRPAKAGSTTSGGAPSGSGGAASSSSSSGAHPVRRDYIEAPSRAQPPALEMIRPTVGVTLRAGTSSKAGPKKDNAASAAPTRSQYQQQIKAKRNAVGTAAPHMASSVGQAANSRAGSATASAGSGAAAAGGSRQQSAENSKPAGSGAPAAGGLGTLGRPTSANPGAPPPAGAAAAAAAAAASAAISNKWAGRPDVHLALTSASDWGTAVNSSFCPPPPLAVAKPTVKQLQEEVGRLHHLPKERVPVAAPSPPPQLHPSQQKAQSPAAAGRSTQH